VIVGGDGVSYGKRPKGSANWREHLLREVTLDATRTHFLGRLPRAQYLRVLQVSAAHVYLTYPFVLSWSLLEAMACGAPVIASDTAPVREVIRDGDNGRLVDFYDDRALVTRTLEALDACATPSKMRTQVLRDAQDYSHEAGLAGYDRLIARTGCLRLQEVAA
jgi:glycosyltransferase involved in cell wall biosynthesis